MLQMGLKLNLFTCKSLIKGYCIVAEEVLMRMAHWMLKPDSYSYCTLLAGYCRATHMSETMNLCHIIVGASHDALCLWNLMLRRGFTPNEVSYSIMLDGLFKNNDHEGALKLWKDILAKGIGNSGFLFNTMMTGLCKSGKTVEAVELIERMKELGCCPDGMTNRTLSDGYCEVGNVEQALEVKCLVESGVPLSIEMYNSVISAPFKSRKLYKVKYLLAEMDARGLSPNIFTYGSLIAGWCKEGMLDKALGV
ncbi:Pentatricopeptide repeat [Dillenia turbinata]|uniref:Pentatricopeptide repeat n=1 Tax=Dillenia turbinata TaxID=194707 RepID=A0AAN8VRK9_9MAGN